MFRFIICLFVTFVITFALYIYHRQESKNPLFGFTRKYDNPYDAPIDPKDAAPTDEEIRQMTKEKEKVVLEDVVEGEYDFTG